MEKLRIKVAAIRYGGQIYPGEDKQAHSDIFSRICRETGKYPEEREIEKGFLTEGDEEVFVNRKQAAAIAYHSKQCLKVEHPHFGLMTSDLWKDT